MCQRVIPMSESLWFPPRGAVVVEQVDGRWVASCESCRWQYSNVVRSDVNQQKAWHRCPAGTSGSFPLCPTCRASGRACKRPSGHDASEWHADRLSLYRAAVEARAGR